MHAIVNLLNGLVGKCMMGMYVPVPVIELLPPTLKYYRYATRITLSNHAGGPSILGSSLREPITGEKKDSFGRVFVTA